MELDMEMDEGQPQGCPLFLGWERRFWREYAAGLSLEADWQLVVAVRRKSSYIT